MLDFKPKSFQEIAGQTNVKSMFETFIKYSNKTGEILPHILMLGKSGYGKTSFAEVLALETKRNLITINCPQIGSINEIFDIFKRIQKKDIVFMEEIQSLKSRKIFDSLLVAFEQFYYTEKGKRRKINEFTAIGATTDEAIVPEALRNRFKYKARLVDYTEDELIEVSYLVAKRMGFDLNKKVAKRISEVSRGIPREVAQNTEFLRMYMIANELKSINSEKFYEIVSMRGFNKDGLREHDLEYLRCLDYETLSLNILSSKLGIDKTTVQFDVEPYLLKLGLIEISTSGRSLTQKGTDYVRNS